MQTFAVISIKVISFHANCNFLGLLITLENSLDPDVNNKKSIPTDPFTCVPIKEVK